MVYERLPGGPHTFAGFMERHPELLDGRTLQRAHGYDEARLGSELARSGLLLPRP